MLDTGSPCSEYVPGDADPWWVVQSVVSEFWIDNTQGNSNFPNIGEFKNAAQARPQSEIKLKVQWSTEQGGRNLYFDHNLQRNSVAADTIQTAISIPITGPQQPIHASRFTQLQGKLVNGDLPIGIVSITQIEHWAYRTIGPIGGREGRYTIRTLVPSAGGLPNFHVPPGATDLQITGTSPLVWRWTDRPPIRVPVGTVNVPLGEGAHVLVAGTGIEPAAAPLIDSRYKLTFTVKF